ncbi:MAG: hypothetical protein ACRC4L_02825, partial [Mycoplasma sp.]
NCLFYSKNKIFLRNHSLYRYYIHEKSTSNCDKLNMTYEDFIKFTLKSFVENLQTDYNEADLVEFLRKASLALNLNSIIFKQILNELDIGKNEKIWIYWISFKIHIIINLFKLTFLKKYSNL